MAYFPFESTKLMPEWYDILNTADEIWTPSPLMKQWMHEDEGLNDMPIYVFEHGVDPIWTPTPRNSDQIRFLHLGFESARKYGPQTLQAFRTAFPDNPDVTLTLKMNMGGWKVPLNGKVTTINRTINLEELIGLFHEHNVFLFMSAGEGFGLPPLQAMATGMPTVVNSTWAPYSQFLDPNLNVSSVLKPSPWQDIHPGKVLRPDFDECIDRMRYVVDNYDKSHDFAQSQTEQIMARYDWLTLTKDMLESLEKRL